MDLSERAIDLLKNDKIARTIVKKLLDAYYTRFTHVEGRDPEATTGAPMLKFDAPDKKVHSIAKELCKERILGSYTPLSLPVYHLIGEKLVHGTATPRNEELRKAITPYFK